MAYRSCYFNYLHVMDCIYLCCFRKAYRYYRKHTERILFKNPCKYTLYNCRFKFSVYAFVDNTLFCNTCRTGLPWKYFRTSPHSKGIFLCNTVFNAYILHGQHKYNRWNKPTCCNNNLYTLYFYFFCHRIALSEHNRYKNGKVEEDLTKIQSWYLLKLRLYFIWIFGKIHPVLLPELQNFQSL